MTRGWLGDSQQNTIKTALKLTELGVNRFIYTDVIKDGTLTEPNYMEILALKNELSVPLVVGGGIASLEALEKLRHMDVEGVIIGKALYENKFTLKEANNVS